MLLERKGIFFSDFGAFFAPQFGPSFSPFGPGFGLA